MSLPYSINKKQKTSCEYYSMIDALPDELLTRIFSYIDFPQILTLRLVNRRWSFVVYKTPLRVDLEYFLTTYGNVTALSSLLTNFAHIMHLEMGINELSSVLPIVKNLTTLKKFTSLHPITLSEFSHLVQFRHMTTLLVTIEVEPEQDSTELNRYLSHFPNLKCLTLSSDGEPLNIDISVLSSLRKLSCLSLDNFSLFGITPNCKPIENLKALSLTYGTMESQYLDWFIKPCVRQLEVLELIHMDLMGEMSSLKYLRHLNKLKTLHFQLKHVFTETFEYVMEGITNCSKLRELGLYCTSEEVNFQVQKLSGLTHLRSLTLSGCIEDIALKNICNFSSLHSLALESELLTNEAIAHINKIGSLKFLDIQNTNIHDVGELAEQNRGISISMCQ